MSKIEKPEWLVGVGEETMLRVKRGVEWLDANYPGWESKVIINTLDMSNGCRCILGQLFQSKVRNDWQSGFCYALDYNYINFREAKWFGFDAPPGTWDELQAAWEKVLVERQGKQQKEVEA